MTPKQQDALVSKGLRILWILWLGMALASLVYEPSHNADGGYIEACGDEPGLQGDDC